MPLILQLFLKPHLGLQCSTVTSSMIKGFYYRTKIRNKTVFVIHKRQFSSGDATAKMVQQPIVKVQEGQLVGKTFTDYRGGLYYSFQGIPYAKPPIGEFRFKAPQPAEPWSGVRDATRERSECFSRHMIFHHFIGSEDCLFLNVYTPELPSGNTALKPVMVWIHGGAFTSGSGNVELYSPDFLLTGDVVVVTINYRLGLLGFLSLEDTSLGIPGNAGLKDQVLALKWIKKNIAKFSGDPDNVTIFGESAGAASVHYLMLSSMAKGLFHKVIAQSGSALGYWARGQRSAAMVAKALNLKTSDEKLILNILQNMPMERVYETQEKALIASKIRMVGPVIEKPSKEPALLLEDPVDVIMSGNFNKVPLLIGYTSREGMLWEISAKGEYGETKMAKNFEKVVPCMLKLPKGSGMAKTVAQKIKQFYYGNEEPSVKNIDQYYLLQTDTCFLRPIYLTIKLQGATSSTPIYFYRMSVDSNLNVYKKVNKLCSAGVCHADDLGYLFKTAFTPKIRPRSIEDDAIKRFVKLWTTFARYGDPNPVNQDPLINITWKPVQKDLLHFLDIGENLTVGINPEAGRMAFWDEIYSLKLDASKPLI